MKDMNLQMTDKRSINSKQDKLKETRAETQYKQTVTSQRKWKNLEISKREVICHIHVILDKINNCSHQKKWRQEGSWMTYLKCWKKKLSTKNFISSKTVFQKRGRASLVAQWLRICLPLQGTWVRALVWEDPTCHRATGPVSPNYWACTSGACAPQQERPR